MSGTPSPQARSGHHLREAALAYAEAGFAVFPLHERGKKPMTPNGYLDATRDRGRILDYWMLCPTANIGLAVPPGLVVIDFDNREALLQLKAEDRELPATVRCTTGRGVHLYYATDQEIRNAAGLLPGVDLRGQGGYVVVPPSIHPSGARYRWEVPLSPTHLAEAPGWLHELVSQRSAAGRARPPEEWRKLTQQGVGKGERNCSVASLAGHLLRHGIDPYVTLNLLLSWNTSRCRPPLPDAEVVRTVDSIAGRELRRREARG